MFKSFAKIFLCITFTFFLFSCASGAPAAAPRSAVSSYEASRTDERMIAYIITLQLSVRNTQETKDILSELVQINNGFIVRISDNSMTARIPADDVGDFMVTTRGLGKVESESTTGVDITDQYRDNLIRLENLKSVRARYLVLLEMANTVGDILSIERELERVNTEIDIMEGRIRHAEASVEYSNVTVRFFERARPGPVGWIFYGLWQGIKWLFIWD